MKAKLVPILELVPLSENPRIIDTYKYQTLVASMRDFPEMSRIRPLLVNLQGEILCGNMRYKAALELGWSDISVIYVDLPKEKQDELVIKDNISYGDWDDQLLETYWDKSDYEKWLGIEKIDYSLLDYEDLTPDLDNMTGGVRKAISVEMGTYSAEVKELVKQARKKGLYIGAIFYQALNDFHENT